MGKFTVILKIHYLDLFSSRVLQITKIYENYQDFYHFSTTTLRSLSTCNPSMFCFESKHHHLTRSIILKFDNSVTVRIVFAIRRNGDTRLRSKSILCGYKVYWQKTSSPVSPSKNLSKHRYQREKYPQTSPPLDNYTAHPHWKKHQNSPHWIFTCKK